MKKLKINESEQDNKSLQEVPEDLEEDFKEIDESIKNLKEAAKDLLNLSKELKERDKSTKNASLLLAILDQDNSKIENLLKDPEIDVNKENSGITPLVSAIYKGKEKVINMLLDHKNIDVNKGVNINNSKGININNSMRETSPLILAILMKQKNNLLKKLFLKVLILKVCQEKILII